MKKEYRYLLLAICCALIVPSIGLSIYWNSGWPLGIVLELFVLTIIYGFYEIEYL